MLSCGQGHYHNPHFIYTSG